MRDSAFATGDRFTKEAFTKNVGKTVPLLYGHVVIGEVKLVSVVVNEGHAQALFDFDMYEDAGFNWRNKKRSEVAIVEDRTCKCSHTDPDYGKGVR
jgi:hypothetical protein